MTKLFSHSGIDISGVTSVRIPALTTESISCLNFLRKAKETFLAGFLIDWSGSFLHLYGDGAAFEMTNALKQMLIFLMINDPLSHQYLRNI